MTSFKTIAATAIIAVAGTVAAFSGLHIGQSNAAATTAQAAQAKTTYTISLSAKQLATLMHGQQQQSATHHVRAAHHQRQATHRTSGYRSTSRSYSRSGRSYSNVGSRGSYRCYNYGRSGGWGSGSSGSHFGGGWGGGCW